MRIRFTLLFFFALLTGSRAAQAAGATGEVARLLASGRAALQQGSASNALAVYRKALALDAGNRDAKYGVSMAYIAMERYQESLTILDALSRQYPEDYLLKNNEAWLLATAKDPNFRNPARAVNLAREALLIAPSDPHVWSTLAEAHYVAGSYDQALKAAVEMMRLAEQQGGPNGPNAYREQFMRISDAAKAFMLME